MTIRAGFIIDQEELLNEQPGIIISALESMVGLKGNQSLGITVVKLSEGVTEEFLSKNYDLLVIDYGGASFGSRDNGMYHVKELCTYAENHTGTLLVIWTSHTYDLYEGELQEQFGHLDNITTKATHMDILYYTLEDLVDGNRPDFKEKFTNWFNKEITEALQQPTGFLGNVGKLILPGRIT